MTAAAVARAIDFLSITINLNKNQKKKKPFTVYVQMKPEQPVQCEQSSYRLHRGLKIIDRDELNTSLRVFRTQNALCARGKYKILTRKIQNASLWY